MQVKQLASIGVKAVRISGASQLKDVAKGEYRFGLLKIQSESLMLMVIHLVH